MFMFCSVPLAVAPGAGTGRATGSGRARGPVLVGAAAVGGMDTDGGLLLAPAAAEASECDADGGVTRMVVLEGGSDTAAMAAAAVAAATAAAADGTEFAEGTTDIGGTVVGAGVTVAVVVVGAAANAAVGGTDAGAVIALKVVAGVALICACGGVT